MDFKFTDEQELLRKMIQKFAEKEIAPRYEEIEKEGYQQDLTDKMADVGIVGIAVPEAYGGAGYDFVTQTMVIAELAKVNPGVAFTLEAHRSEEHTSELQSRFDLVCRLLLEKNNHYRSYDTPN